MFGLFQNKNSLKTQENQGFPAPAPQSEIFLSGKGDNGKGGRDYVSELFEEVETVEDHNEYFCSIAEVVSIVVLGSTGGLKNVNQIYKWAECEHVSGFLKEKFGINRIPCCYWLLVLLIMVKTDTLNQYLRKWALSWRQKLWRQSSKGRAYWMQ